MISGDQDSGGDKDPKVRFRHKLHLGTVGLLFFMRRAADPGARRQLPKKSADSKTKKNRGPRLQVKF